MEGGRCRTYGVKQEGWLIVVDGDDIRCTTMNNGDVYPGSAEDLEMTLVSRLEGLLHIIDPDEHVQAVVEASADEGLRG